MKDNTKFHLIATVFCRLKNLFYIWQFIIFIYYQKPRLYQNFVVNTSSL